LLTANTYFQNWGIRKGIIDDASSIKGTDDNGRTECYRAQFQSVVLYMPVLTRGKINTYYTLIDYVDFEEPSEIEIDEVF